MIRHVSQWFRAYGFADVEDGLIIGAYPMDGEDVAMLNFMRVQRVLNLVEDEEYPPGSREVVQAALAQAGIEEHRLGLTDFGGLPAAALEQAVELVNTWLDEGVRTYMHCRAGRQRSAAVAAGVIAVRHAVNIDEAVALVQMRKPSADPLPHQRDDLRQWWETRQQRVTRRTA